MASEDARSDLPKAELGRRRGGFCRVPKKLGFPSPTHRTAWVWENTQNGLPQEPDEAGMGESTVWSSLDLTPGRAALRLRAHRRRSLGRS